ncbi:MAG: PP2C family protein-serine/threonine phosphatase [Thermoanaerobaculia bacterium]
MSRTSVLFRSSLLVLLALVIALLAVVALTADSAILSLLAKGLLLGFALLALLWLLWKGLYKFLWSVGRRLAFSYFLIGIFPIPLLALLLILNGFLLSGYFLGHLYRDAASSLQLEVQNAAESALVGFASGDEAEVDQPERIDIAFYHKGRRVAGSKLLPSEWPGWLDNGEGLEQEPSSTEPVQPFVALADEIPTLVGSAAGGDRGVLAVYVGPIDEELGRRNDLDVTLMRGDDPDKEGTIQVSLGSREFALVPFKGGRAEVHEPALTDGQKRSWWQRPILLWGELAGPLRSLQDGSVLTDDVVATLRGRPARVFKHLFSGSAEVNTAVWASLISVTGLLATIYGFAFLMAFFLIFALSRAVNRLSRATNSVRAGDFSTRIPVKRGDQIGELQRSFNEMTANLEESVAAVAQKEILDKELQIARDLQQSLIPADIPTSEAAQFSTLFEPSAAIGGDYFDILRLDDQRLVVVIADVSGHGLPTGLRMAMLKAALVILVEEGKPAKEILRRLSTMVNSENESRFFVTASIAFIDLEAGEMELTNAGHPPTYLLRGGLAHEILLPGNPLGALGESFGQKQITLAGNDVVVWLSDGLIEGLDPSGEPFGYDRLKQALNGPTDGVEQVSQRLLAAVESHARGVPASDDRTLVAMHYRPAVAASANSRTR